MEIESAISTFDGMNFISYFIYQAHSPLLQLRIIFLTFQNSELTE